jgi:zinc/manganese transport system substrate-binding protein
VRRLLAIASVAAALAALPAQAKLAVITTIPDLAALASEVAGDGASVESIGKGTQDPHYLEAKPSYMVKLSRADLLVAVGLDLETAWLGSIQRGARNPRIMPGAPGFLEVGPRVDPLEVPQGSVTRAEGDVHPLGNPHVTLDPERAGKIALLLGEKLAELDPAGAAGYRARAQGLQARLVARAREWKRRLEATGIREVVTYHKTLNYFLERFGIRVPAILEPKPGIPPTSGHIIQVVALIRERKIRLVLVENYFDPAVTRRIAQEVPSVRAATVAVSVGGAPGLDRLDDVYEKLVAAFEGGAR